MLVTAFTSEHTRVSEVNVLSMFTICLTTLICFVSCLFGFIKSAWFTKLTWTELFLCLELQKNYQLKLKKILKPWITLCTLKLKLIIAGDALPNKTPTYYNACFHSCRVRVQMSGSLHVPASLGWCSRARPSPGFFRGGLWGASDPCCWIRAWLSERRRQEHLGQAVLWGLISCFCMWAMLCFWTRESNSSPLCWCHYCFFFLGLQVDFMHFERQLTFVFWIPFHFNNDNYILNGEPICILLPIRALYIIIL